MYFCYSIQVGRFRTAPFLKTVAKADPSDVDTIDRHSPQLHVLTPFSTSKVRVGVNA